MSKNHHTMFRRLTTTTLSFIRNNSRSNTPTLYFCPFSLSPQPWGSISHHRSRWRFRHTSNFHPLQSSNLQNTWQQHLRSMPMRFFLPFQSQLSLLMGFLFFSDCGGFAFFNFFSFQFVLLIPSRRGHLHTAVEKTSMWIVPLHLYQLQNYLQQNTVSLKIK